MDIIIGGLQVPAELAIIVWFGLVYGLNFLFIRYILCRKEIQFDKKRGWYYAGDYAILTVFGSIVPVPIVGVLVLLGLCWIVSLFEKD